jgi:hypothetical protein
MKAVVLHEYGGPEKLKFEDDVPARGGCRDEYRTSANLRIASIRLIGKCDQGRGRRIFRCRFLQFWAATSAASYGVWA